MLETFKKGFGLTFGFVIGIYAGLKATDYLPPFKKENKPKPKEETKTE